MDERRGGEKGIWLGNEERGHWSHEGEAFEVGTREVFEVGGI